MMIKIKIIGKLKSQVQWHDTFYDSKANLKYAMLTKNVDAHAVRASRTINPCFRLLSGEIHLIL